MKHVRIIELLMAFAISRKNITCLDRLVYEYQQSFLAIPEYFELWKPKTHFYSHFATDVLLFGPARLFWCPPTRYHRQCIMPPAAVHNATRCTA